MTPEEQAFAEKHYSMVSKFLRAHRLPEDEFYDVVIFGYLEAVQRNFRVAVEPEKRNFTVLARLCMETAVCRELRARYLNPRKANYMTISLDSPLTDDEDFSLHDILPSEKYDVMAEVENRDLIRRTLSVASEREFQILALYYAGFSSVEISQMSGLSISVIHRASTNLHAKARPIKDGNPPGLTPLQRYYQTHKAEYAERNSAYRKAHSAELKAYKRKYRAAKKAALNASNIESGA